MSFIGLYWKADNYSKQKCAHLVFETLNLLRQGSPFWFDWYLTDKPKKGKKEVPIEINLVYIEALLKSKALSHIDSTQNEPELGYNIVLKSSKNYFFSTKVFIHCGSRSNVVGNRVVIEFPSSGPFISVFDDIDMELLFNKLIDIWSPIQGLVSSSVTDKLALMDVKNIGILTYSQDKNWLIENAKLIGIQNPIITIMGNGYIMNISKYLEAI